MLDVIFETDEAIFYFNNTLILKHIDENRLEYDTGELFTAKKILMIDSGRPVRIPQKYDYFKFIAIDLILSGIGSINCKACKNTKYEANQINIGVVGHGRSPVNMNHLKKGETEGLFQKEVRSMGRFGGRKIECPKGHELLSVLTWMT